MTYELKPCPFCYESMHRFMIHDFEYGGHYIYCENCESRSGVRNNLENAIKAWNNRSPITEIRCTSCDRCSNLETYISNSINQNYYKCGLWIAERIKKAIKKNNVLHDWDDAIDAVFECIDKILEEERQRQESKK